MASNSFLIAVGAWALTYLAHSTLLLGAAALMCRRPLRSPALRERFWKSAAVAGVLTSLLAVFGGWGFTLGDSAMTESVAEIPLQSFEPLPNQPKDESEASSSAFVEQLPAVPQSTAIDLTAEEYAALEAQLDAEAVQPHVIVAPSADLRDSVADTAFVVPPSGGPMFEDRLKAGLRTEQLQSPENSGTDAFKAVTDAAAEMAPAMEAAAIANKWGVAASWLGVVVLFWMLCGALRLVVQEMSLRRLLKTCVKLKTGTASEILTSLLNGQRVRLLKSNSVLEPLACGVFAPTIVLPARCEDRLEAEELRALLAHELAHLQRGDVRWLVIGRVLCTCLGFQPLNHVARRAWQAAAEIQCDDWAIEHNVSALSLARCLATVAEWRLDHRTSAAVLTATSNGGPLTHRIERLLSDRVPDVWRTRWRSRLSLLAAFVCGLLFATYGPRLDESLWARVTDEDVEERLQLWNEIRSEIESVEESLDRLPVLSVGTQSVGSETD